MTLQKKNKTAENLYKKCDILKFGDLVPLQNYLFNNEIEHGKQLSKSFSGMKHIHNKHNYNIRAGKANLFYIHSVTKHC